MKKFIVFLLVFLLHAAYLPGQVRYELPAGMLMMEYSHELMKKEIGVSNKSNPKRVKEYLDSAGVRYYNPFCSSGITWALMEARAFIKRINEIFNLNFISEMPYPKTAMANGPYNYARKKGKRTDYRPSKHDRLTWRHKNGVNGHIETVDSVMAGGWVRTIAFNTGNRQVKYKKRNIFHILGRLRIRGLVGFRYEGL